MPNILSKFIDKAKPRFSFHHHRNKSGSITSTTESNKGLSSSLPTPHIFGYRDDIRDDYVEPPPIAPLETKPTTKASSTNHVKPSGASINSVQNPIKDEQNPAPATDYTPITSEQLPSTPPATPGGSFLVDSNSSAYNSERNRSQSEETTSTAAAPATADEIIDADVTRPHCQLKLDNFKIQRTLGTGSFGRVHLVQSKVNNRYYALKVLKKAEIVKLKQVEHTNNERAILISIQHPFIVNLWGSFQDCTNLYMVMDYIPGGELFSFLRRSKKFSNDVARFYAGEVLLAIAYLHSKNVIYRDLKPENLLLDAHGHIKITDFGFAKRVPDITWTLCGTPDYLAPEIIQTKGYGKAADYWAFGVLVFEMLAGFPPYYDDNQFKLYEKILTTPPKYPSSIDSSAKDLLKHLLTTDLTQRYGNLKGGYHDIRNHKWFASLDFDKLIQRKIKPPHIPHLKGW